jgi:hypothetical protein
MLAKEEELIEETLAAPFALNDPEICLIPEKSRSPLACVAMAMEPEKVGHAVAIALASPPF